MTKYKLKLSAEFINMLYASLLPFKNFSISYINLIYSKVYYFLDIAIYYPYSFPKFNSLKGTSDIRRIIIDKRFIVFFKITDNVINIDYFVDGRRSTKSMIIY